MTVPRLILVGSLGSVLALTGGAASAARSHGGGGHSGGSAHVSAGARHGSFGAVGRSAGGYHGSTAVRRGSAGAYHGATGAYRPSGATWRGSAYGRTPGGALYSSRGGAYRGGTAQQRHPRAGTGTGGYYHGRPYYGGHYHGYGRYYGGYYYPYYYGGSYWPYYYGGYYGPSFYLSFGWPYTYSWPYYATGYYSPSAYPPYDSGDYAPGDVSSPADEPPQTSVGQADEPGPPAEAPRDAGRLRIEVRPDDASVYVDDQFRGLARQVRFLTLPPGRHVVELVRPGFVTERREVEVVTGETRDVLVELQRP
jgi:hypothetical protein